MAEEPEVMLVLQELLGKVVPVAQEEAVAQAEEVALVLLGPMLLECLAVQAALVQHLH